MRKLYLLLLLCLLGSLPSIAQINVALTATAAHSGGGATGSPDYSAVNYNDNVIAPNSGTCTSTATPWGWVGVGGTYPSPAWITFTWGTAQTFDKIVLYKSNRPMTGCDMQYWNGSAFVTFLTYSGGTCTEDSVSFPPVTTTILRLNNIAGTNPNHREIRVIQSSPTVYASPTSLAFGNVTNGSTSAVQTFSITGVLLTSSPLTVGTSSANFEFSFNGTTWYSTSQSYTFTPPGFTGVPIYVRFTPTALGPFSGNITFSGSGLASTFNVPVTGTGVNACTGTPAPGAASITPGSGAAATPFTLSLSGTTAAGGLTYQWQSSSSGTGPFTNITGATTSTYGFTGIGSTTFYQALVTCPTFAPATSNTVTAAFVPTPACVTTASSWFSEGSYSYGVGTFTVTAATGPNLNDNSIMTSVNTSTGYLNRTALTPITLYKASTYPASISYGTAGTNQYSQVWIDFNNDGTFSTSEEVTGIVASGALTATSINPVNFNINIPSGVSSGVHLMRVRGIWEYISTSLGFFPAHMDPCLQTYGGSNPVYYSGTCVDYYVDIEDAPPCGGIPSAGTITSSQSSGCTPYSSTMVLTGATGASGLNYQWYSSTDNVSFSPVAGATNNIYSAAVTASIYYKCTVTCVASSQSNTTPSVFLSLPAVSYASLPFFESFENSWINICNTADAPNNFWRNSPVTGNASWRREDDGGSSTAPGPNTAVWIGPTTGIPNPRSSDAAHSARFHSFEASTGATGTLDLYVNLPSGTKQINYDYFNNSGTDNIVVQVSTDGITFTTIDAPAAVSPTWGTHSVTTTVTGATCVIRFKATSDFGADDIGIDNINVFVQAPCTTPTTQPTAMTFTPGLFNMAGSFTASSPATNKYLTIMTTTNTPPDAPVSGTNYAVGSTALGGTVVGNTSYTTFSTSGLTPGTQYWFWTYGYNALCIGGPLYNTVSPLSASAFTNTCNLSGVRTVGPTGDYPTITAAMADIYNNGLAGPLALELQTTYAGAGETYPIAINNIPCASAFNTLTIRPQGPLTITYGGGTIPLFDLNGAKYVTIDGRVGSTGTTKALTISHTNTGGQSIRFTNDASYNTVKYCTVKSVNTSTVQGTIFFYITNGSTGNDYNTIDNCDLLDGATTPLNAIYNTGTTGKENDHNTVSNCNIANYFGAASASNGILLSTAATDWTITNNRFYQTASRTFTSGVAHRAINISNTAGNNFTVTGNIIGSSSSAGTGNYTMTVSTATLAASFYGIALSVGNGVPSSVQGNTFGNINFSTGSTINTAGGALCGISITSGSANIGDITPNIIGSGTATGSIVYNNSNTTASATGGAAVGINGSAVNPASINIRNNIIGGINYTNATLTVGSSIQGIQISSTGSYSVTGNTIGSVTAANSFNASSVTTGVQLMYGINSATTTTNIVQPIISNNTVANLTAAGTGTSSAVAGIINTSNASATITGNNIFNIASATANTIVSGQTGVMGIGYYGNTLPLATITNNTIHTISNTNTTAIGTTVCGIGTTNAVGPQIGGNKIYDLRNANTGTTATAPPKVVGILVGAPTTTGATIYNNMISLGNAQTTNTSFTGIMNAATTALPMNVYFNTVNIQGTASSGALPTACMLRGNYSATAFTTPLDIRNNIFTNTRAGGTGKHYAIANTIGGTASATGWGINASNYNILNATAATVGYWSADKTFATWKTASASDANSYSATPVTYTNAANGDLHINMGTTANNIESHGILISGVNNDFDGQARPGPAGSVNGGAFAPDLGADEFDGVAIENLPPNINYTTLLGACGTGDRVFSATIIDPSGVPSSGTQPRVYYKKGAAGAWFSQPGTLASGTLSNGVWNFTIVAADMGGLAFGDQVYYYVIAQDAVSNIGSIPSAGLVATNVNTVTTPPSAPYVYTILQSMGGNYDVGASGAYATITAAVAAYNTACLSAPVTFTLTDAAYPSEVFPITINANPFASAATTLTIKPASGVAVNINSLATSTAIFKLLNASYITIDGVNTGATSLSLNNGNTGASALIWLASTASVGPGNNFITLKNMNLTGGTNTGTTSSWAILSGADAASPTTTAGKDNDNITIQNNTFQKAAYGIYAFGTATTSAGALDNWLITGNTFGPAVYSATDNIGYNGMWLGSMVNPVISGNTIQNIGLTTLSSQTLGIGFSSNVNGGMISQNNINGVFSNYTTSGTSNTCAIYFGTNTVNSTINGNNITNIYDANTGGYAPRAITITSGLPASNDMISNNMISNVYGPAFSVMSESPAGIAIEGTSGGIKVYHNTINLATSFAGYNIATFSACLYLTTTGANIDVRNNIFTNTYDNTTVTTDKNYAVYATTPASSFSNMDYNVYNVSGSNPIGIIGATDRFNMAAMQAGFGGNTHSLNIQPLYVTPTNLHLQVNGANAPLIAGAPLSVTNDFDGTTRSGTIPVIGAHEVYIPPCNSVAPGLPIAMNPNLCVSGVTTVNLVGASVGLGLNYQWYSSPDSVAWTSISGATQYSYSISAPISATTFYRVVLNCTLTGSKDSSATKVRVNPLPAITVTPDGGAYCSGSSLTMGASGGIAYTWSPSSGLSSTNTAAVTTNTAGTMIYTVTGTDINGCSSTHVSTVTVTTTPPAATITAAQSAFCTGGSTQLTASANLPSTILTQDFNSGLGTWTITNIAGVANAYWQIRTSPGYSSATPGDGTPLMEASADATGSSLINVTTYVSTPIFSLSGYTSATLTFNQYYDAIAGADIAALVEYSLNGGGSWNTLVNYTGTSAGATTWTAASPNATIAIPPAMLNQSNVMLRWNYNSNYGWYWAIDNVKITGVGLYNTFNWSPATNLYSDAALTVPYTGGNTATVYAAPVAPVVTTNNTYTANVINGTCINNQATKTLTVNPLPANITGSSNVCVGSSITLGNAVTGGTWSSASSNVSVVGSSGVVTGINAGTADVTYTLATGCNRITTIVVNPLPAAISGNADACIGATNMLSDATLGGTWSSSDVTTATISNIGALTGIAAGYATITYTLGTGCIVTQVATVNVLPVASVTPATSATVCMGQNVSLTASTSVVGVTLLTQDFNTTIGSWTISNGLGNSDSWWQIVPSAVSVGGPGDGTPMLQSSAISSGSVNQSTVTSPSFSTIGYASATLTFNETVLTDIPDVAATIEYSVSNGPWQTLQDYPVPTYINTDGSWSAAAPQASIELPAAAIGQGNVRLRWRYDAASYWWMIDNIRVSAIPPAATYTWSGAAGLSCTACDNSIITPTVQGLNSYSVTAITSHNCTATIPVTVSVNPMPSAIGGNPVVCEQSTTTLSTLTPGGTWTSSAPTTAFVNASTGIVTGVMEGTATITYTLNGGCYSTMVVTVNQTPAPITGSKVVCSGLTTALGQLLTGGNWSSNTVSVATVNNSGVVTGVAQGTADINYTMALTGCKATATVTVNPTPSAVMGELKVCEGATTALGNSLGSGNWTSGSLANATVDPVSGVVTGVLAGTARITYAMPTTCMTTAVVTVNTTPVAITGASAVCEGYSTGLNNTTSIGIWSSNSSSASVNGIGVVYGNNAGVATISYTLITGCYATKDMTVNTTPAPISGTLAVCESLTTALSTTPAGGNWTSNAPGTASIDMTSGEVTGNVAGNTSVSYTLGTGCYAAANVTVNPTPAAIMGNDAVCEGLVTPLTSASTGGNWTSNDPGTAAVDAANGMVTGVQAGNTMITYTLPQGCNAIKAITVNPTPAPLTGTFAVCEGSTTALNSTSAGGTWMSTITANGTVDASGNVSGILAGTANIIYTLPEGCTAARMVTVNPSPAAITGTFAACEGASTTLGNAVSGGSWSSAAATTATVDAVNGIVTGVLAGNTVITYTLPAGCLTTTNLTVNPQPAAITGITTICRGTTTTLGNAVTGGSWATSNTAVATVDPVTGEVTGVAGGSAMVDYTMPEGCTINTLMLIKYVSEVYTVTGTGSYCNGGNGVAVGLSGSDLHSNYQLYSGTTAVGTQVAGTGGAISFGMQTAAATYTVVANEGTGCSADMNGNAVISINPLPNVFNVTGGGDYCSGTIGRHVGLFGSQVGISYSLYTGGSVVAAAAGLPTSAAIDFGSFTTTGTYTVQATNTSTNCTQDMPLSAIITMAPSVLPGIILTQNVGSIVCNGSTLTYTAAPVHGGTAPVYNWSVNGAAIITSGNTLTYVPMNGDVVKAVMHSNEYCAIPDSATASMTMTVEPYVMPTISINATPGNKVCKNTPVTFGLTQASGGSAPVYTWVLNGAQVSAATSYTYTPVDGDIIYCMLTSNAHCRLDTDVYSNNEAMMVDTGAIPVVGIKILGGTSIGYNKIDSFQAVATNAGSNPSYKWFINGAVQPGATSSIFTTTPLIGALNGKDSITVQVTNNSPCGYSTFNSVLISNIPAGVAPVFTESDLRLIPNPNTGDFVVSGTLGTVTDEEVNIEVTDMLGQIVYKGHTMSKAGAINERIKLSNTLANGMYMLNVKTAIENKVFHFVLKQ